MVPDASRNERLLLDTMDIVNNAGRIVAANIDMAKEVKHKGRIDLVTEIDVKSEEYLKKHLNRLSPKAGFWAEESVTGEEPRGNPQDLVWVVDPVDGTTNYAHGLPQVAVSVALWDEGRPVLGVICLPVLGEVFAARQGGGAFKNGDPIRVTKTKSLEQSLLATGFPYAVEEYLPEILKNFETLLPRVRGIRRMGAAALDMAYLACGRFDAFYETGLKPWDTAAGVLLVTEAGGKVSRYDGETPYELGDTTILASNALIHPAVAELLWEMDA